MFKFEILFKTMLTRLILRHHKGVVPVELNKRLHKHKIFYGNTNKSDFNFIFNWLTIIKQLYTKIITGHLSLVILQFVFKDTSYMECSAYIFVWLHSLTNQLDSSEIDQAVSVKF